MEKRTYYAGAAVAALIGLPLLAWASGAFDGSGPSKGNPIFPSCMPTSASGAGDDRGKPVDRPRHAGDRFIYRDGAQVRDHDRDGRPATLMPDGTVRYADGSTISHNSDTGESRLTRPDGRVTITSIHTPQLQDGYFVWGDGTRLPETAPDGAAGKINPDGSVSYPDGTTVRHDPASRTTTTTHGDGSVTQATTPGTHWDDDGNLSWNDGVTAPGADSSGRPASGTTDGWIRYPDGTLISHDPTTGETKLVRSDGTIVIHNDDTCETRVIRAFVGCLGQRSQIDRCLVGTWEQSGGGPMEWLKRQPRVPPIVSDNMGKLVLKLGSDGRFASSGVRMEFQMHVPDRSDPKDAHVKGGIKPTEGQWSAQNGRLQACFGNGGGADGTAKVASSKGAFSVPFSTPGDVGQTGGVSYNCAGDSMTTSQPMPRGEPMRYTFRRVSR